MRRPANQLCTTVFVLLAACSGGGGSNIEPVMSGESDLALQARDGKLGESGGETGVAHDMDLAALEAEGAAAAPAQRRALRAYGGPSTPAPAEAAAPKTRLRDQIRVWQRSKHRPSFARVYVGNGNSLALERMRVTVTIEGPRARTVVDHVFKNPHDNQLEGTFEYPLPSGASVCYYAMFVSSDQTRVPRFFADGAIDDVPPGVVAMLSPEDTVKRSDKGWGRLREARVVRKEKARKTYEEVVRRKIDPALLEYAGGNTFRGRVFPIPPQGFNRVIIAYEEPLQVVSGRVTYRFPLPDCELGLLHVTATMPKRGVASETWSIAEHTRHETKDRITYDEAWEQTKGPGGELTWSYEPENARVQAIAGRDPTSKARAFYARIRPELPATVEGARARRAIFLVDTSLSEEPDRFNTNVKLLNRILEHDTAIDAFDVICFDAGAWSVGGGFTKNDRRGRARVLNELSEVLLEGATDLSAALRLVAKTDKTVPTNVFVLTDGQVNLGERDAERLLDIVAGHDLRFFCYRTGLSAENLELFAALTRRGGAVFNVFSEKMAEHAALAHRRPAFIVDSVRVEGARDVVVAGRQASVYPGGEIVVAGRVDDAKPHDLVLEGRIQGEAKTLRYAIDTTGDGELAARGWAEIAVGQMLGLHHPEVEPLAAAYAQRFRIGTRVTSFLVLETDKDYEEFGIGAEASKLEVDDVGRFLEARYARHAPVSRRVAFGRFLTAAQKRTGILEGDKADHVRALFGRLKAKDFDLPAPGDVGPLPLRRRAAPAYLTARAADRKKVDIYLDEAMRRNDAEHGFGALRALSSIVELNPGRSDALRLVGYRLLSLGRPAYAADLFDQVRAQRPFEPHGYRDLARSLAAVGKPELAAIYYELLLAGKWHARFHDSIKVIANEEYVRMMRTALKAKAVGGRVRELFGSRLEELGGTQTKANLRVTISWNTDSTDVDLWVVEPSGEACGYNHKKTKTGGELLDDLTAGYGPERYQNKDAPPGEYVVLVKYYSPNANLIAGESHVDVSVTRHAGMVDEETETFTVILREAKESFEVCRVRI